MQPTPAFLSGKSHGQRSLQAAVYGVAKSRLENPTGRGASRLQSTGSQRVDWKIPRAEEPPGCSLWGRKESNTTEHPCAHENSAAQEPAPPAEHPGKAHSQDWSPGFLARAQEQAGVGAAALAPGATRQAPRRPQPSLNKLLCLREHDNSSPCHPALSLCRGRPAITVLTDADTAGGGQTFPEAVYNFCKLFPHLPLLELGVQAPSLQSYPLHFSFKGSGEA